MRISQDSYPSFPGPPETGAGGEYVAPPPAPPPRPGFEQGYGAPAVGYQGGYFGDQHTHIFQPPQSGPITRPYDYDYDYGYSSSDQRDQNGCSSLIRACVAALCCCCVMEQCCRCW